MEEATEPPQWMLNLENKLKRQHRLAHEIGAGSPCIKCVDSCPGLDLHFWRKLCRNCKCKREEHDIGDDGTYIQFDILLCSTDTTSKTLRRKKQVLDLPVPAENKQVDTPSENATKVEKVTMDWVPPGITLDLAAEYMQKLPSGKLPIAGSAGALYRRQQLERQLPAHDLAPGLCHQLSQKEVNELNKYLTNLKESVVGQGKVEKLQIISHAPVFSTSLKNIPEVNFSQNLKKSHRLPESRNLNSSPKPFVPSDTTSSNRSHNNLAGAELFPNTGSFNLKTPGAFVPLDNIRKFALNNNNKGNDEKRGEKSTISVLNNNSVASSETGDENHTLPSSDAHLPSYKGVFSSVKTPFQYLQHSEQQPMSGSQCVSKPLMSSRPASNPNSLDLDKLKISEMPENILPNSVHLQKDDNNIAVPEYGEINSDKIIGADNSLGDKQVVASKQLNCQQCGIEIHQGEVVVSAERAGDTAYWHPQCFICASCNELLVDLVYFFHQSKVYCGRHYAEIVNIPRCFACDELIFVNEYTMAEEKTFHVKHFCCFECDTPLAGKEYIPVEDNPVCLQCYRTKHSKVCLTCEKFIEPTDKRVSVKDMHWHAMNTCFCCHHCRKPLFNSKMVINSRTPYCNKECALAKYPV